MPDTPMGIKGILGLPCTPSVNIDDGESTAAPSTLSGGPDTISDNDLDCSDPHAPADVPPWDWWEQHAQSVTVSADESVAAAAQVQVGLASADMTGCDFAPAMPVRKDRRKRHRVELSDRAPPLYNALVARPVGKAELEREQEARDARDREWNRLRERQVWDESVVWEWDDLAAYAKAKNKVINFGYLFGICVEKGSELLKGDKNRKYKYRVVFQGNRVVNQDYEAATFEDMGSSPATLESSRACDLYGCAPGHDIEMADAEQAYVQALLTGIETWICLPPEARIGDKF